MALLEVMEVSPFIDPSHDVIRELFLDLKKGVFCFIY